MCDLCEKTVVYFEGENVPTYHSSEFEKLRICAECYRNENSLIQGHFGSVKPYNQETGKFIKGNTPPKKAFKLDVEEKNLILTLRSMFSVDWILDDLQQDLVHRYESFIRMDWKMKGTFDESIEAFQEESSFSDTDIPSINWEKFLKDAEEEYKGNKE